VLELGFGSASVVSGLPATGSPDANATNVVVQQQSRKLLNMDILMPETC